MKMIYNFEQHTPPVLNENMLRSELEKRRLRKQTMLLAIAGILVQIALVMFGLWTAETYPLITVISFGYVVTSIVGGSVIALVYTRKGGLVL